MGWRKSLHGVARSPTIGPPTLRRAAQSFGSCGEGPRLVSLRPVSSASFHGDARPRPAPPRPASPERRTLAVPEKEDERRPSSVAGPLPPRWSPTANDSENSRSSSRSKCPRSSLLPKSIPCLGWSCCQQVAIHSYLKGQVDEILDVMLRTAVIRRISFFTPAHALVH